MRNTCVAANFGLIPGFSMTTRLIRTVKIEGNALLRPRSGIEPQFPPRESSIPLLIFIIKVDMASRISDSKGMSVALEYLERRVSAIAHLYCGSLPETIQ